MTSGRHRHRRRPARHYRSRRKLGGGARRRLSILLELLTAAVICVAGYLLGARWMQVHEAAWVVRAMNLAGFHHVSGVLPGRILIFRPQGGVLVAVVTTSCSSLLSLLGLAALTVTVLRSRRVHAPGALLVAAAAVVIANDLRLAASTAAGWYWGRSVLILFHDWVGTVWTFASTLGGFLLMVCLTLPAAERAEQDVAGRHTARRPGSWARPGLGYRVDDDELEVRTRRRRFAGLIHRYVLPRPVSRWLARRREAGRIDYRIGHLRAEDRAARVAELAADGLGVHTASLIAVATHEDDAGVLDALAAAIAARQWEPVVSEGVASLRLWARGWMLSRSTSLVPEDFVRPIDRLPSLVGALPLPSHRQDLS